MTAGFKSISRYVACGTVLVAGLAGAAVARAGDEDPATLSSLAGKELHREVEIGFKISPVRLDLGGKSPTLVGLGSYIVNTVAGCNDCHTAPSYLPGHDPFQGQPKRVNAAGYLGGGQHFGPFVSRNLTPEHGLPAGRTFSEFLTEMRTGADLDNPGQLLQVMPWPSYQHMTNLEMLAIYTYLSAIPPVKL